MSELHWIASTPSTRRLIRVFPRRTRATPDDALAYVGPPDLFAEADEVHVSVTFTYDKPRAEQLAEQWRQVTSNVKVGGVAYGDPLAHDGQPDLSPARDVPAASHAGDHDGEG